MESDIRRTSRSASVAEQLVPRSATSIRMQGREMSPAPSSTLRCLEIVRAQYIECSNERQLIGMSWERISPRRFS